MLGIITYKYIWPSSLHMLGYSRTMESDQILRARAYLLIPFMIFFGTIALLQLVKKEKIDIINAHWIIPNGLMALIVSKLTGVKYTVTIPGTDAYLAYRYKIIGWVAKIIVISCAGLFSNSLFNLKRILRLGVNPKIRAVVSYPVDINKFRPSARGLEEIRKRHGLKKSDIVVLAVGRMVYKKGYDYLIKALKPLKTSFLP